MLAVEPCASYSRKPRRARAWAGAAREDSPTGQGDDWDNFDNISVNNLGNYIFSGDTDGSTTTDEFLAYNGSIVLREGQLIGGRTLGAGVDAASMNELGQVAFVWDSDLTETLFAGNASDLANSIALLSIGDELDVNGDLIADYTLTDFEASNIIGPGIDLAENGRIYVEVEITAIGGSTAEEAIIGIAIPEPATAALLTLGLLAMRRRR